MSSNGSNKSTFPGGALPAQLGLVLVRRATLGHVAATLVSLAERGPVTVTSETDGDGPEVWLLSRSGRTPHPRGRFETELLDGIPDASDPLPLTDDNPVLLIPALRAFRNALVKDAVHQGWLRHLHHDQLTPAGEELAGRARRLRTELRHARAIGDRETLTGRLPYALAFGLIPPDSDLAAGMPLARFAAAFAAACSDLPEWQQPPVIPQAPEIDTWSRNSRGGLPPGGGSGAFY